MSLKKPNVLLVGSAKAGTTALFSFLSQHEAIENPKRKEPKFLSYASGITKLNGPSDQKTIDRCVKDENEYKQLYSTDPDVISIDGSVDNLYHYKKVIPIIKDKLGDVKIIISLRNPITRAFSAYAMQVRDQREQLSFKEALDAENQRIKDSYEFIWYYKNCGLYYNQVKAYFDNFSQVKVIVIEDFKTNSKKIFDELLTFLGLDTNYDINFSETPNKTGIPKNKLLHKALVLSNFIKRLSLLVPVNMRRKLHQKVVKRIIGYDELKYNGEESNELYNFFKEDIYQLSKLLERDLYSLWLKKYG